MGTTDPQMARPYTKTRSSGPVPARILICGEAPGVNEEIEGIPFVGSSGQELDRMLQESGLDRSMAFLTNVCKYRPPENKIEYFFLDSKQTKPNELILEGIAELHQEISRVKPELIITFGNTPLWALTGNRGITKWRGSMLTHEYQADDGTQLRALLLPTYHPAAILRQWDWRPIAIHDLRRAAEGLSRGSWPARPISYLIRPSFTDAMDCLGTLTRRANEHSEDSPLRLASDLETRAGYISCHGIAWSPLEAICIPNLCVERPSGYFTLDEDVALWQRERTLLTHPNVEIVGQNYLYDAQYFARRRGYVPRLRHDTMAMQHTAWPGLPKGLDFLSSMYCQHHVYWKDEGKEWDPKKHPEERHWRYNCDDSTRTYEVCGVLERVLRKVDQWETYQFQMRLWRPVLDMMLQGVSINLLLRNDIATHLLRAIESRQERLHKILGYELNPQSPKQMFDLFYTQLRCTIIRNRKTKRPTCDEDALKVFAQKEPLLKPITDLIIDIRGLGSMMSNVIMAGLDADLRLRTSFNPYSAETLRWTSSKNAWGGGTNLQNWTKGDEDKEAKAITHTYPVPNVRKLIIPDNGYEIASIDLSGADAQTVAWESDDEDLKAAFRSRIKIHAHNAKSMFPGKVVTGFEQPYYDLTRTGVHLVNYVGGVETLAAAMGIPRYEAQAFMDLWFGLHPNILDWHNRIQYQLQRTRTVANKFGYRRFYFDRVDGLLPEAVAWIGQSTTACVTNRAFVALKESARLKSLGLQVLMQVHDELVFQYPYHCREEVLAIAHPLVHITVPYDDPLVIPWGLKTSTKSWGECESRQWPT